MLYFIFQIWLTVAVIIPLATFVAGFLLRLVFSD